MGKKSAYRTPQPLVAVVPVDDVLALLGAIAEADAIKGDIAQSGADSFDHWITQQLRPKAEPENAADASPDLNAIRDQVQRHQPRHVTAYVVQGTPADVAEVLRSI